LGEAGEKQATLAKRKRKKPALRETAPSAPEETLPRQGPTPLDGVAGVPVPRRLDTALAEIGSLLGDRSPTPQPEDVHRKKSRQSRKRRARQENREAAKLDQPSGPPSDNVSPATEQDDAEAAHLKISGDGPTSPKREVIDLTVKEESRPGTPIPPPQISESSEGVAGLKAGWVRLPAVLALDAL
jgi:hypothetical protein